MVATGSGVARKYFRWVFQGAGAITYTIKRNIYIYNKVNFGGVLTPEYPPLATHLATHLATGHPSSSCFSKLVGSLMILFVTYESMGSESQDGGTAVRLVTQVSLVHGVGQPTNNERMVHEVSET